MFGIYLKNKRYNTVNYPSYEAARSHARKLIRKGKITNFTNLDWNFVLYNNPSISFYGVSIRPV